MTKTLAFELGPQNSRGFRALKVWLALRQVGRDGYRRMIADDMLLAGHLHEQAAAVGADSRGGNHVVGEGRVGGLRVADGVVPDIQELADRSSPKSPFFMRSLGTVRRPLDALRRFTHSMPTKKNRRLLSVFHLPGT